MRGNAFTADALVGSALVFVRRAVGAGAALVRHANATHARAAPVAHGTVAAFFGAVVVTLAAAADAVGVRNRVTAGALAAFLAGEAVTRDFAGYWLRAGAVEPGRERDAPGQAAKESFQRSTARASARHCPCQGVESLIVHGVIALSQTKIAPSSALRASRTGNVTTWNTEIAERILPELMVDVHQFFRFFEQRLAVNARRSCKHKDGRQYWRPSFSMIGGVYS